MKIQSLEEDFGVNHCERFSPSFHYPAYFEPQENSRPCVCVCVFSLEFNLISSAFSDLFPRVALFKKDTADEINQVPHTRLQ